LGVPPRPVLPGRAGLQPVPGRPAEAPVDGHADLSNPGGPAPSQAGLRPLPCTGMPIFVAPVAGPLAGRIGGRPILFTGMALQAVALGWLALVIAPTIPYEQMVVPFILAGVGMGLFFAPIANVVLSAVRREEESAE